MMIFAINDCGAPSRRVLGIAFFREYFSLVKKSHRMELFLETLDGGSRSLGSGGFSLDPCYLGYVECFNTQRYYEAHDVLEHLWLKEGREAPDAAFHQGLIQLAGGFVHLKLQRAYPEHPKHGRRLAPARRLFLRAAENLMAYRTPERACTCGMDVEIPIALSLTMARQIEEGEYARNPWEPNSPPLLPLPEMGFSP